MSTLRLLIVMPSWVGDAVMATPALRLIRSRLPGIYIGALVRPGIDQLLAGSDLFDEVHADRPSGMMGYKHVAARLRQRRYDTALLLTNSFSTALITRLAGVPRRIGYNRDARGLLLTDGLEAPRRSDGGWALIPAAAYYWHAAKYLLDPAVGPRPASLELPPDIGRMELVATEAERAAAAGILEKAGVGVGTAGEGASGGYCILNPGGNNPAKRWLAGRFIELGRHLGERHGMRVLVNGSPAEAELVREIAAGVGAAGVSGGAGGEAGAGAAGVSLPDLGGSLGSLKALLANPRCRLMVTNDTGPRHIAAAFGVPVVTLFGPTDPRWTTIPVRPGGEAVLVADPTLPADQVADDHPERCRIDRIEVEEVIRAVEGLLGR
jgi:heptosyltransferase II